MHGVRLKTGETMKKRELSETEKKEKALEKEVADFCSSFFKAYHSDDWQKSKDEYRVSSLGLVNLLEVTLIGLNILDHSAIDKLKDQIKNAGKS